MIYTVTLNPTLDRTLTIERFHVGGTFKSSRSELLPAGKGINVARVVAALGEPVTAFAVVGEQEGAWFAAALQGKRIAHRLYTVPGATRNSITILDPVCGTETHLREQGSVLPDGALRWVEEQLALVSEEDWVVFAGSLPPGVPTATYRDLIRHCTRRGAHTALDTSGAALLTGLEAPPSLIKPNLFELWQVDTARSDVTVEQEQNQLSDQDVIRAVQRIQGRGIEMIVLSRGARGVLGLDGRGCIWHVRVDLDRPAIDAVGSGDALVAGLVVALARGDRFADALRLGVACGAANTLVAGAGRCRREDVVRLASRAVVCAGG
jgi:1-phosphofructokinase family hexose kinase